MSDTATTSELASALDPAPRSRALDVDQLDYMTDLIAELREMAKRAELDPLATILALAQAEAARESSLLRRRSSR